MLQILNLMLFLFDHISVSCLAHHSLFSRQSTIFILLSKNLEPFKFFNGAKTVMKL